MNRRRPPGPSPAARPEAAGSPRAIANALARWFAGAARDLPWRRKRTGYRALVAEAMLQQTQVARVVERYEPFLARFPTVAALAAAPEDDVLAAWQGLGYYRRARHLHRAARAIVADHGGRVPSRADVLAGLPGVGRYTAGAIASIVHGEAAPIVDGNVARVLARLEARRFRRDGAGARRAAAWAWSRAERLTAAARRPGATNEALMELGATICTPRNPRCAECPLARVCAARRHGLQDRIPPPKAAPRRVTVHHHAILIAREGRVFLVQRPRDGLWAGLWQPPTVEGLRALRAETLAARSPLAVRDLRSAGGLRWLTTHRDVRFHLFTATSAAAPEVPGRWVDPAAPHVPMANAHRAILRTWMGEPGLSSPPRTRGRRRRASSSSGS